MPTTAGIRQAAYSFVNEYPEPNSPVSFSNPVVAGNIILGFTTYRYIGEGGMAPFSDSQGNVFTELNDPTLNVNGEWNCALAYTVAGQSGPDTVTTPIRGLNIYDIDSCAFELEGVQSIDSVAYFTSDNSDGYIATPITGSLTVSTGDTFTFTTPYSYQNWTLILVGFKSTNLQVQTNVIVYAFCSIGNLGGALNGVSLPVDNWTFLHSDAQDSNLSGYNGIYYATAFSQVMQFQYPSGAPVANGYLTITLDRDVVTPTNEQITAGRVTRVDLDDNGQVNGLIPFSNADLLPSGSSYYIRVYSPTGQLVRGPYPLQLTSSWL